MFTRIVSFIEKYNGYLRFTIKFWRNESESSALFQMNLCGTNAQGENSRPSKFALLKSFDVDFRLSSATRFLFAIGASLWTIVIIATAKELNR